MQKKNPSVHHGGLVPGQPGPLWFLTKLGAAKTGGLCLLPELGITQNTHCVILCTGGKPPGGLPKARSFSESCVVGA